MNKIVLVTGCAAFVGGNFVCAWLGSAEAAVVKLAKLTDAGNLPNLEKFQDNSRNVFVQGDIRNES